MNHEEPVQDCILCLQFKCFIVTSLVNSINVVIEIQNLVQLFSDISLIQILFYFSSISPIENIPVITPEKNTTNSGGSRQP